MTVHAQGTVLLVEAKSSGLRFLPAAARLGLGVHVLDRVPLAEAPGAVRDAVSAGLIGFTTVDVRSATLSVPVAVELAAKLDIVAVVPGFEYSVPVAARIAAALGLRGPAPGRADALRYKDRMKRVLAAASVPVAPGVRLPGGVGTTHALDEAAASVGFPAVVKPVDGSGSLLVRRVDGVAELAAYLAGHTGPYPDEGVPVGAGLLLERYVPGREYSVEGYVRAGNAKVVAITEKRLGPEPSFAELGHLLPARLDAAERTALEGITCTAVRALGLAWGTFHVEVRLGPDGPVVVEVGARLGGAQIPALVCAVHGVDLAEAALRAQSGLPEPTPAAPAAAAAATWFLTVTRPGRLGDPERLRARLGELPGCVEVDVRAQPGARVSPPTDFRQRFGHVVVHARDRRDLDAVVTEVDRLVEAATGQPA